MGNYSEGDGAYPHDDLKLDEDKPLCVTKCCLEKEKETEDNTPTLPQLSQESVASMEAMPEGKQKKRICTKANLEREQKREQVIEHAEKLLGQAQDFDPELEFYCSSLMPLLEKLDFETRQRCMIAVRQVIFKFMFPKRETAAQPMWARRCRQGGPPLNQLLLLPPQQEIWTTALLGFLRPLHHHPTKLSESTLLLLSSLTLRLMRVSLTWTWMNFCRCIDVQPNTAHRLGVALNFRPL